MREESIWIATWDVPDDNTDGHKGWGQNVSQRITAALRLSPVSSDTVASEWGQTMRLIGRLIRQAEEQAGGELGMQLDEVTLVVEINSKGQVGILGTCMGEASGKGAITLKFKRSS